MNSRTERCKAPKPSAALRSGRNSDGGKTNEKKKNLLLEETYTDHNKFNLNSKSTTLMVW